MHWTILETFWKRIVHPSSIPTATDHKSWDKEIKTLYQLGIGMEDTLQFLYIEKPDFKTFKAWVINRQTNEKIELEHLKTNVLSGEDLEFWDKNGYIIIKEAISKKDCEDTQRAIWDYLKMDPNNKGTWYTRHENQRGLMLNFSDHETLNKNRFSPRIRKAYEQLYNTNKIYKTIDKVSFNPPETIGFNFLGSPLHWDTSLSQPITFGLQGLLYLTDCGPEDGAFHCVPGFHNEITQWLNSLEPNENPRDKAIKTLKPKPVIGNAGDFIIWNNTLPHCATPNKGKTPRMVQYLTYLPEDYNASGEWL
ncbi:phytanoyl-CoA dioxygenase family protein [Flavobacterium sp. 1355]|uniref:phytanoyl-CoA dioxygenase family protein n=1 Tax=Flavobacterium sp. 1355 TaxID=2806571 RepID=UPI001AE9A5B0|nr:phytanoyl-CoA dioxygenase family protein [Flavobacterium sp. 1355]MBP1221805.1 ectoine hydroxylase-related dioxygenase (phytanoyl-CoA dioxygenase family) [Flavobacterium sp. 1355]